MNNLPIVELTFANDPQSTVSRWSINAPSVVSETVDGETIIVNLASGTYYSLLGSAADIWNGLVATGDVTMTAIQLSQRYDLPLTELGAAVEHFLSDLVREDLLLEQPSVEHREAVAQASEIDAGGKIAFSPPVLEKFSDMQEMLVLDPIHEVSPAGWPHQS